MSRKVYFLLIGFFLLAGGFLLWPGENNMPAATAQKPASGPSAVSVVAAEGRVTVKPDHRAVLSAEVSGRVEQILVDNLSPVRKGQVLAVIYNADLENNIRKMQQSFARAQADYQELAHGSRDEDIQEAAANVRKSEADLDLARRNEERDRKLTEEGVLAKSRYDGTAADFKKAESQLQASQEQYKRIVSGARHETIDAARAQMKSEEYATDSVKAAYEKTYIRSPLDGIVIQRYLNASEFADVGTAVLEVADLSQTIVDAEINEMDAGRVKEGQTAVITADAFPGQKFSGRVYEVSMALKKRSYDPDDPAVVVDQKVLPVKVEFIGPVPLKLGMKVDLKIQ